MNAPQEIGKTVQQFCNYFSLGEEAVWVPVDPRADSTFGDCFKDVERQVSEKGGDIVYGWIVWEWPRILIEGEFHAVWKSPVGKLIDLTTKPDGEQRIVFVPDPQRSYEGRQRDNLRLALWDHNLVHEFIEAHKQMHELFERNRISELASAVDVDEHARLQERIAATYMKLMSFPRARSTS